MTDSQLTLERVYKEHSARILATLVRLFGPRNLELAEDVLQEAFRKALVAWQEQGVPENPAAWIVTAAKRHAIDTVRAQRTQRKFSDELSSQLESGWTLTHTVEQEFDEARIVDHQLRMIFMCANADVPADNRIPLMLRTLCGFGLPAISRALLLPEATIKKRLVRTREKLRGYAFEFPAQDKLPSVMDSVHTVLYLLFNEGFHSTDEARAMNLELCREAIHLATLLVAEPRVVNRDTLGLLALMQFHLARAASRVDGRGDNVPIDQQDRTRWDAEAIAAAARWVALADNVVSSATDRFYIEAKIAEQHCRVARFEDTDWAVIVDWYAAMVNTTNSPLAALNRAVALGYAGKHAAAVEQVASVIEHDALRGSHMPSAVLAHVAALAGDADKARHYANESCSRGGSAREQRALHEQIERLLARAPARGAQQ
jgi:RNA polymerase sigma-70 factor (ECF subfamily)